MTLADRYGSENLRVGRYSRTGVSQASFPSSTSDAIVAAVKDLVTEAMSNTVSASTGSGFSSSFTPKPFARTIRPWWTTATAAPGTWSSERLFVM